VTSGDYLLAGGGFVVAALLTALMMPFAARLGTRFRATSKPRLFGQGEAGVISNLGGLIAASVLALTFGLGSGYPRQSALLLAGGFVILVLGTADDRVGGIGPVVRVAIETGVAAFVWWGGFRPVLLGPDWADALLVVFVLVAAANAFNLLDNMDGVAGSSAVAIGLGIAAVAAASGEPLLALLGACGAGTCLGFLRANFRRATVYLGNGGALLFGFVFGGAALAIDTPLDAPWEGLIPITLLAVPAVDTGVVILSRVRVRKPVYQGGVDHLSHRLVALGLSTQAAALAHGAAGLAAGAAALAVAVTGWAAPAIVLLFVFAAIGLLSLRIRMYEEAPPPAEAPDELQVIEEVVPWAETRTPTEVLSEE
jgi:UDP-GlcNAc:undecaprenyl-phosphate GlcNAc-1-phosphate transferase